MNAEQFYDENLKDYNLLNLIDPATAKQAMKMMEAYKQHCTKAENLPISDVTQSKPDLESIEFFNLMQQYRMAPMTDKEHTIECFDKVKDWIRAYCG